MESGQPAGKILLFHAGALGDLVNTLPAIGAIRSGFPNAQITAVGNQSLLVLLEAAGMVEEAVSLESPGFHTMFGDSDLPHKIKEFISGHDLAVFWIRSPQLVAHITELGLPCYALEEKFPPPPGSGHATEFMAGPLSKLGIKDVPLYPRLDLPPDAIEDGPKFYGILVHPGSGSAHKNWRPQKFAEAAISLADSTGHEIAVLEGPADKEAAQELIGALGGSMSEHFSDLNALELAALLSSAALLIGNDSGVSHLAGALGTRVVAIYGPSDPGVWGVRQPHAKNIRVDTDCAPCSTEDMRECKVKKCMESIAVEDVVSSGLSLLTR